MAVVSQPYERGAKVPAPGQPDAALGEFWVDNPWNIIQHGHNLSAYERKRLFLNVAGRDGGRDFLDVSALSGADNDGDGRSVVAADFRNNGRLDLLVRQVGGGPVLLYENNFPQRHYLEVTLHGTRSNRQGIGARLTASVRGRVLVRELFPANSYRSQAPCRVHFGLGDADRVEWLNIRWPSGHVQEFKGLAADRHIVIEEDSR
jgi:enediyne biosynthesis protein E4